MFFSHQNCSSRQPKRNDRLCFVSVSLVLFESGTFSFASRVRIIKYKYNCTVISLIFEKFLIAFTTFTACVCMPANVITIQNLFVAQSDKLCFVTFSAAKSLTLRFTCYTHETFFYMVILRSPLTLVLRLIPEILILLPSKFYI